MHITKITVFTVKVAEYFDHPTGSTGISDVLKVTERGEEVLEMHFLIKHHCKG